MTSSIKNYRLIDCNDDACVTTLRDVVCDVRDRYEPGQVYIYRTDSGLRMCSCCAASAESQCPVCGSESYSEAGERWYHYMVCSCGAVLQQCSYKSRLVITAFAIMPPMLQSDDTI